MIIITKIIDCGTFTKEALGKMETCGFYVEGIGLAVVGSFAILANIFTLYVFLRYERFVLILTI